MLLKTRGIVLHAFKYGETSLITEMYTEQSGLRKYIVNGVRSSKPRFPSSLFQVLTPLEIVGYQREDKDLNRLKEARLDWIFQTIPFEHRRGAIALFTAELIRKTVREAEHNPELYAFLDQAVRNLDHSESTLVCFPIYLLVHLSIHLGFQPAGQYSAASPCFFLSEGVFGGTEKGHKYVMEPEVAEVLYELLTADWAHAQTLEVPASIRRTLFDQLLLYYQLHLETFQGLNSPHILRQVLG